MDDLCHSPEPDGGQAAYVRGLTALRDGDANGAVPWLEAALRAQPGHDGRRRNLVRALLVAGRFDAVLWHTGDGLAAMSEDAELHFARGSALSALGRTAEAQAALATAVTLRPAHAPSWLNLANTCVDLDELAAGEALCRQAIAIDPALAEAHTSLAFIFTRQGRIAEAVGACDRALALLPGLAQAGWNRAIALLLGGDLPAGFAAYECRKTHPRFRRDFPPLPGPQWDGADPAGSTILVRAEQGAGDTIQFARYLRVLEELGAKPVLLCAPALRPLIRGAVSGALPAYDAWVDQISLPHLLGTSLHTVPAAGAYLQADPARIRAWHRRLPPGLRIGLAFAGNPAHGGDRHRSIPPGLLRPLLDLPGVTWINLQHGPAARLLALPDLTAALPDFGETAALVMALDLVVTVDSAVAHLSGALGRPTWIMLPHAPDWRWMLGRTNSPWYAAARLYRQHAPGDWPGVVARVRDDLRGCLLCPAAPEQL